MNMMMCFSEIPPGSSMNPQNRNEMMFIPPTGGNPISMQTINDQLNTGNGERVSSSSLPGDQNFQGLSLSLNTQMSTTIPASSFQFQYSNPGLSSVLSPHLPLSAENSVRQIACKVDEASPSDKDMTNSDYNFPYGYSMNVKTLNCNTYQYEQGCSGVGGTTLKSKYLKATQELLDEVVNVQDALKRAQFEKEQSSSKVEEGSKDQSRGSEANESGGGSGSAHELSPSERQELQSKLDKLHSMLDEVDRRYKQYCQQMQLLASSFDVVAGNGAAKPYTSLALKTISRHFRCLRDAITNQIETTRKSLGEQDNGIRGVIPRLRYVDQQLRQQRALQQFGMMRHSWRPQRGLPENAVTILRAWLFEHFLHPYPKDSEKILLARQTGLTRSQVANWFINARVRLWKPMIEDMYKEEFGEDIDTNSKSSQENTPKLSREKSWGFEDKRDEMQHETSTNENHGFYANGSIPSDPNGSGNLMVNTYQIPELGNFDMSNNNQVSLALGLRHSEGDNVVQMSSGATTETTMPQYPYMDQIQVNQQHRFGNPQTHILSDFVA